MKLTFKFNKSLQIQGAQQKIYVLETTEKRQNQAADGTEYGITNVLSSTTNFTIRHELYMSLKHLAKFQHSVGKCLLLRGFSQRESDKSIRISDTSIVSFNHKIIR